MVRRVNMYHHAEFNFVPIGKPLSRYVFSITQHGGRPPSWICFTPTQDNSQGVFDGVYRWANFGSNRQCSFEDVQVSTLCEFCLKMPNYAPFGGFGARFPKIMLFIVLTPKRTILRLNHVIWAINRKKRSRASSWALVLEKKNRTGQEKNHKRVIFHLFVEKPLLKRRTWKFV